MISIVDILGVNIFLFIFSLFGSNLRHSHIKIKYPNLLENLFISPYQHQIHHSNKYFYNNYGGYLAIWDKIFGTLAYSKDIKTIQIGVAVKSFQTLFDLLITPFLNSYKLLGKQNAK